MLKKFNRRVVCPKEQYKKLMEDLSARAGLLQRQAREAGMPIILLFEGIEASGKGTLINRLILSLDPRGFKVHSIIAPTEEERLHPYLWRFWKRIPPAGGIAVFDRGWYRRVLAERVAGEVRPKVWRRAYDEILSFERQLTDAGYVIIKFWLQISRKEQKRRFKELEDDLSTSWRVTKDDWRWHRRYDELITAAEEMIERTSTPNAPWHIIPAKELRSAVVSVYETFNATVDEMLKLRAAGTTAPQTISPTARIPDLLARVNLSVRATEEQYDRDLPDLQERLREVEHTLYRARRPLIIVYEGWDAAGKGGNIKRLVRSMDPRGYEVVPVAAPNDLEKRHHYLWRFWISMPKFGHITIFDRSWYGRVLVERVEGFCSAEEYLRAYREINEMEQHLAYEGAILVKFWLHIDKKEQPARFKLRESSEMKRWKITAEDYRNREKWDRYAEAVNEMLYRANTPHAPWVVVESNCKYHARLKTMRTIIDEVERRLEARPAGCIGMVRDA